MSLDELLLLTEKIKKTIYDLKLKDNDVRKAYFENLYAIVYDYYKGKVFFEISKQIGKGNVRFAKEIYVLNSHIKRVYEIADHQLLSQAYQNDINRKLLLESFTNFEVTLNLCFEKVISLSEKNKILDDLNKKILRICKYLEAEKYNELLSELRKSSFIPLSRKFRFVANRIKNSYSGNYKEDVIFIEFCSKLRNIFSHSNGLYLGKDFEHSFQNVKFSFVNNQFLVMDGNNSAIILQINEKFTDIMYRLLNCFNDIDYIEYPDDGF
ncbi:hypothetical protein ACNFU2_01165 [Chryseobacterium sp. PTM-20240506]|uniref:hypothetical protein n=1 Tax=Weeksellaceae TaxID=2762318 RepID=UPI0029364ACC|nr:hypothetical protein [Elizabethkingia anophelis]MDV2493960.1 hypothetical protein [Elizabethkingia anophelis]MDV3472623.1 hypothetical protein [Elizabethkingia anophelis]MDV3596609.1 hypothetical protein [Elizabethkingia anophelis]MDV3906039.1 hypothetical protein [Elizabethkingia anophelis]